MAKGGQPKPKKSQPGKAPQKILDKKSAGNKKFSESREEFPQRLEQLRGSVSKNYFANSIGISSGQYEGYLSGTLPGMDVLLRVIEATGCDADWLLTGRGEPFPTLDPKADERRNDVRAAWDASLTLLRAAAQTQHALAPLIGPKEAGPTADLVSLIDHLRQSINDLRDLARTRGEPIPDPDYDSPATQPVHVRRIAGATPITE